MKPRAVTSVLALLPFDAPMPERSYALVWSLPRERCRELMALDDTAFVAALMEATRGEAGELTLASPRAEWPLPDNGPVRVALQHAGQERVLMPGQMAGPGGWRLGFRKHLAAESQALRGQLPDALAVEMEGAAVAQVCSDFARPFAVVRTISDRADDSAHVDFATFIEETASVTTRALVERLMVHTRAA